VVLHGHGSSGDQLFTRADLRDSWLRWALSLGVGLLTPHLRGDCWMAAAAAADLSQLVGWLRRARGAERVLLVGGSMGGTGALIHAVAHPRDVDAVAALCPATDLAILHAQLAALADAGVRDQIRGALESAYGGTPARRPAAYAAHSARTRWRRLAVPLYVAHGTADALIDVGHAVALRDALPASVDARFEFLPAGDHDAPLRAPGLLPWLEARR
jgi:pimeloyl-ACP methyl ester carboxylesterase